jgi:hypothetical protein
LFYFFCKAVIMRNFQILDIVTIDSSNGILYMESHQNNPASPRVAMRHEGDYLLISASYGPVEIALRARYQDVVRTLARMHPVEGLQTTRQIGTGQTYLSIGLQPDQSLLLRPTLVGDASGMLSFNLELTSEARIELFRWLQIELAERLPTSRLNAKIEQLEDLRREFPQFGTPKGQTASTLLVWQRNSQVKRICISNISEGFF